MRGWGDSSETYRGRGGLLEVNGLLVQGLSTGRLPPIERLLLRRLRVERSERDRWVSVPGVGVTVGSRGTVRITDHIPKALCFRLTT